MPQSRSGSPAWSAEESKFHQFHSFALAQRDKQLLRGEGTFWPRHRSPLFSEDYCFLNVTSTCQWEARQGERRCQVSSHYSRKRGPKYCPHCFCFPEGPIRRSHNGILLLLTWTRTHFCLGLQNINLWLWDEASFFKKKKKIILANQLDHSSCARGRIWQLFLNSCGPNQLKKKSHLGASLKEIFSL